MSGPPQIMVSQIESAGDAGEGAYVTISAIDERGRPFVLVLPLTQGRALIAPLMAAVGSAHRRQRARLGNDQAVVDHLGVAVMRPSGITVGQTVKPGESPEVLVRLLQDTCPMMDIIINRSGAVDLSLQLQSASSGDPPSRLQ